MRRGMAENVEGVGVFFGEDLQFDVVFERAAQIDEFAIRGGAGRACRARRLLR